MATADKTLWVAGPPDIIDEKDPLGAYEGRQGGRLLAFSKQDGNKLAELKIDTPPAFDGMSIANKKLYLALIDGTLVCYGPAKQ